MLLDEASLKLKAAMVASQNSLDYFLDLLHIAAGYGDGVVAVLHDELHGARLRNNMFHLAEVDNESSMTAYYHEIGMQSIFHLFRCGAEHI